MNRDIDPQPQEQPRTPLTEDEQLLVQAREASARASHEFLNGLPKPFRHAGSELEYDKIYLAHARYCFTTLGKSALLSELRPKSDVTEIDRSLAEIEELRRLIEGDEVPNFGGLDDIGNVLRKVEIAGSSIYVEEGAKILRSIKAMRSLREYLGRRSQIAPQLWKEGVHLFDDRLLEMHFESVFDQSGAIKDSASAELQRIRREILHTADQLRNRLNTILKRLTEEDFVQEDLITQREGRFVVPVKVEHKRRVPGFIHSVSQSGQTVFVEPSETLELNNDLRSLEFAEQREIDRILRTLADQLRGSVPQLQRSLRAAAHLESVYAKSKYAAELHSSPIKVEQQVKGRARHVLLRNSRHPILFAKLGRQKTVPLTLELDEDRRTLILTGPNAGGKTVLLKTLGLIALMAQAGIPVPADPDGVIPMMDGVYVEIGDSQSLADDLSTFSSHVTSLARILSDVTRESLVLLDEIGGGTAPEEGGAIAESILEQLTRIGVITVATTHYGRLAAFAESARGAVNGSMEFSGETLTPTFRFRLGVPGSSHAFEIAERFGLAHGVIERARVLRGEEGLRLEELVQSLEQLQHEARERKVDAERELGAARITRLDYERKRDEVEDIRRTAKTTATHEAEEILKRANTFVERAVREAKEAAAQEVQTAQSGESALKSLRARQEQERQQLLKDVERARPKAIEKTAPERLELHVGAKVRLKSNPGQTGTVVSIKGKDVEIEIGALHMRAKPDQLEVVSAGDARKADRTGKQDVSQATKYLAETMEPRIDLRGLYGDEAIMEVDRFLGDAAAHNLSRLEIVHGIGTGALAKRISQHMKGHPLVATYRYGEPQEGGAGVTIVELK